MDRTRKGAWESAGGPIRGESGIGREGILPEPERRSGHRKGLSDGRRSKGGEEREPGYWRENGRKKSTVLIHGAGGYGIESREPEPDGGGKQPKGERAEISGGADQRTRARDCRR